MKRVCLIGDSIRMGYEPTVRKELADVADIFAPTENGQHTVNLLLHFYEWIQQKNPAVVHIAAGGWDVRNVIRGVAGNIVPLEAYRQNVDRLLTLIQTHTRATTIWATITPMNIAANFKHHEATGHPGRTEGDIERYNAAAMEVARAHGVPVNDIYAVVQREGKEQMLCPDGVHLNADGYEKLGKIVAQKIHVALTSHS